MEASLFKMSSYDVMAIMTPDLLILFHSCLFLHVSSRSSMTSDGGRVDLFSLSIIERIINCLHYAHFYTMCPRGLFRHEGERVD